MKRNAKATSEYPLKRILVILGAVFAVCTVLASISGDMIWSDFNKSDPPTSKHDKSEQAFKDETVYVYTDETGEALETYVDAYITNNQEQKYLKDKTNLTSIANSVQSENLPEKEEKGGLRWKADGNDVSYEGDGKTSNLPVSVEVTYYLNGQEIPNIAVRGVSGKLKMVLKYTSKEKATVLGHPVKVPYFAISMITFSDDFTDISVSSGNIISTGSSNTVMCTAMPGASSILGADTANGISDTVIITGTANNFSKNAIITALNGDVLTLVDDKTLSKINLDKAVDRIDLLSRKVLAVSRKVVAVMEIVDKDVMPKVKATTKTTSKYADKLAEDTPQMLVQLQETAGSIAAKTDVVIYVIHKIKEIVAPEENVKTAESAETAEDQSPAEAAEEINRFINGYTDEQDQPVPGMISRLENNIETEQLALNEMVEKDPTMVQGDPRYDALAQSIETQTEMLEALKGDESSEGLGAKAKAASEGAKAAEEKLEDIDEMLNSNQWLEDQLKSGEIEKYLGQERADRLKKYNDELKDKSGEIGSVLEISDSIPYKTGSLYTAVENILSPQNQESVVNVTKKIASGVRTVDKVTGKIGGIIGKITKGTRHVSNKMAQMYGKYVVNLINTYNSNLRGAADNIRLLRAAQEQAKVYSGLSKGMDGSSTYIFFTPVGTSTYDISNNL